MSIRPRLILADDHATVARLLGAILEQEFEVVATVSDGFALVAAARSLLPEAIVTDVSMPGLDGLAAAAALLGDDPQRRVVLVTGDDEGGIADQAAEIGVLGLVAKRAALRTLVPAVRAALAGECFGLPARAGTRPVAAAQ